jgi:hypothetical protein
LPISRTFRLSRPARLFPLKHADFFPDEFGGAFRTAQHAVDERPLLGARPLRDALQVARHAIEALKRLRALKLGGEI